MTPDLPPDEPSRAPKIVRPRINAPGAGRPRKTPAMHLLDGTRSRAPRAKKPLNEKPVADAEIPPELLTPPRWLHRYAKEFWCRNARSLACAGRLKLHHLGAWTGLCARYGLFERVSRKIERMKLTDEDLPGLVTMQRQALLQINAGCLRFGLDPAGDGRLSVIDGSDVGEARPAAVAPAATQEEDRGETWLAHRGRSG